MKRPPLLIASALVLLSLTTLGGAFYDEIQLLRDELADYQDSTNADFSDIVTRLDDFSAPAFRDVASTDWYSPYVASLAEWNIVSGYKDSAGQPTGEFQPGNQVTIAEILKMALESAQIDTSLCPNVLRNQSAYGHWAQLYVQCAESSNMRLFTDGVPNVNRPATRAEVLTIIHDAFNEDVLPLYSQYNDTAGHLLEADIAYATLNGIVAGDSDQFGNPTGYFRPNDPINRAETTKIIYEGLKLQVAKGNLAAL